MTTLLLDKLLDPASLVVIGASAREDSPGNKLTKNLLEGGFKGKLFLVNPRYQSVLGNTCYKSIKALPEISLVNQRLPRGSKAMLSGQAKPVSLPPAK